MMHAADRHSDRAREDHIDPGAPLSQSLGNGASKGAGEFRKTKPVPKSETDELKAMKRLLRQSGKMSAKQRLEAVRSGYGDWKDRPEWKGMSSVEIAAELRRRSLERRPHA